MAKSPSDDIPHQVRRYAPKEERRRDPIDEAGQALVAMLHQANQRAMEARDYAIGFANQTAAQLRAVEDRIKELEAEANHYRARTINAEEWMQKIQSEINNVLLKPAK
jgi:DNA repair ATPase RecN